MDPRPYFLPGIEPGGFRDLSHGADDSSVPLRLPVITPSLLTEAIEHIVESRNACLSALPLDRIVDAIDTAVSRWLDPRYHLRRIAEELLPAITGYSPPMIREGLPRLLHPFRRHGLGALLRMEFADAETFDGGTAPVLTTNILAGNIPAIGVETLVRGLLVRSACLVKSASGDPLFPALFAQSLAEADPAVAGAIAVAWWEGGDEALETIAFRQSGAVIAYGSDAAIKGIEKRVPAGTVFIPHGHRVSIAAVAREALTADRVEALARRAAWDVGFFDQQGCVSPHVIYVERGGAVAPLDLAERLAQALGRLEERWPRGRISAADAAAVHQHRQTWELRRASGQPVAMFASPGSTAWTVLLEEDAAFEPSCLNRLVRVVAVDDLADLSWTLEPARPYLQTAGVVVPMERLGDLAPILAKAGVTRLCSLGLMQHPPATWRHDGYRPLRGLVRPSR